MAQNSKGAYLNVLQDADGKDVYPITRADGVYMNDGTTAQAKCKALDSKIDSTKSSLQTSFQAGVDGIYNAITAQGTTPASKSQGDVKNAIGALATSKYNQGKNDVSLSVSGSYVNASNGKSARVNYKGQFYRNEGNNVGLAGDYFHATFPEGYYGSEGQAWAPEIRVPVGTMNANGWYDQDQYNAHYNQGVVDADNRANASSTNYKSGYNAGYSACQNAAGTLACSFTGPNNSAQGSYLTFSANQSMSKALVTVAVARDIPSPTINSISCNIGSLTLISSSDSKYDGQVYMRTRQYIWSGNGTPTVVVSGTGMMMEWCTIVKLA